MLNKRSSTIFLLVLSCFTSFSQNIGINNNAPLTRLDVNGDFALRSADLTITAVYTYALDVNSVRQSSYKLKASSILGNFILAGIASGTDGRLITLTNRTGSSMELYNEDATALAKDRIQTGTGANLAVFPNGSVTLQYDVPEARWLVKASHNNSLNYFGGSSGTSYWDLVGANIRNSHTGNVGIGTNPLHSRLEINGRVGSTVAIFGADAFGLGISANNPEIGFNYIYNNGTKTIKTGYGANLGMDPNTGDVYIGNFSNNKSVADFGEIAGYQNVVTVTQTGRVGIGNASPLYKLDVGGTQRVRGTAITSPGLIGRLTTGGSLTIESDASGLFLKTDGSKIQAEKANLQNTGTTAAVLALNPHGGNVGIGLTVPRTKLTVLSNAVLSNNNTEVFQMTAKNPMMILSNQDGVDVGYIKGVTDKTQTTQFSRNGLEIGTGGGDIYFTAQGFQPALMIKGDQNFVGIGTNNPSHQLSVNGTIRSKEIIVENFNWPDYVFSETYQLPSIDSVAKHIREKKHLPGIPNAATIEKEGLSVGAMQTKMMEKIEELTLYVIELKKEIELLKGKK